MSDRDSLDLIQKIAERRGVVFHRSTSAVPYSTLKTSRIHQQEQSVNDDCSTVPHVPPKKEYTYVGGSKTGGGGQSNRLTPEEAEFYFCERAAICEYDGGLSRVEAERLAAEELAGDDHEH